MQHERTTVLRLLSGLYREIGSRTVTQLAFDLDLDRGFPKMQAPESGGHCSTCGRPLAGRYARCHGALRNGVWFAWCDECTEAKQVAA